MNAAAATSVRWVERAACRDAADLNWFPHDTVARTPADLAEVCGRCPVSDECLAEALATDDVWYGVRAGLTATARRRMLPRLPARPVTVDGPCGCDGPVCRIGPGDRRHGTHNGYVNLGCRCFACRDGQADYQRRWKNRDQAVSR